MVGPAGTPAARGLLGALLAHKGEAAPAAALTPLQAERLPASAGRPAGTAERRRPRTNSPLAFLIARRPGPAMAAVGANTCREIDAPARDQCAIEVAAPPRRPLTVRLRHDDFLRLRAMTEARGATYQSLIEAGILGVLTAGGSIAAEPPAAPPATPPAKPTSRVAPAAVPAAKRRSLGR